MSNLSGYRTTQELTAAASGVCILNVMQNVSVQIVRFVDAHQPGWVECELTDADGRRHIIREKVPIFTAELLDDQSRYPVTGGMPCEIVQRFHDMQGRELVRVSTEQCGIESVEGVTAFTVTASLVTSFPE